MIPNLSYDDTFEYKLRFLFSHLRWRRKSLRLYEIIGRCRRKKGSEDWKRGIIEVVRLTMVIIRVGLFWFYLQKELKNSTEGGGPSQQQKLRVCEVCSAYLSIYDSDRR